jgi:uncharacterized metal-binding protein YceD (DUF177 family)
MADTPAPQTVYRLADLNDRQGLSFDLRPEDTDALRDRLGLSDLRKLRFAGTLTPEGKRGWRLSAQLGATVVQPCVVTLAPVTTRIEEEVVRRYSPDFDSAEAEAARDADGDGTPIPEDDSLEPLPAAVDLAEVMEEALALALPLYPRAEGVGAGDQQFAAPGVTPLADQDVKPFAGLAALRDRLGKPGDGD